MGPTWGSTGADRPHVGPINFAMRDTIGLQHISQNGVFRYLSSVLRNDEGEIWMAARCNNTHCFYLFFLYFCSVSVNFVCQIYVVILLDVMTYSTISRIMLYPDHAYSVTRMSCDHCCITITRIFLMCSVNSTLLFSSVFTLIFIYIYLLLKNPF